MKPLLFVYDHWVGLVMSSILFSYAISLFVYIRSFKPGALLALGGNSGNPLYDVSEHSLHESTLLTWFSTWLAVSSTPVLVALISNSLQSFDQVSLDGWWSISAWLVSNTLISAVLQTPWCLYWHSIRFMLLMHCGTRKLCWLLWISLLVNEYV